MEAVEALLSKARFGMHFIEQSAQDAIAKFLKAPVDFDKEKTPPEWRPCWAIVAEVAKFWNVSETQTETPPHWHLRALVVFIKGHAAQHAQAQVIAKELDFKAAWQDVGAVVRTAELVKEAHAFLREGDAETYEEPTEIYRNDRNL